MLSAERIALLKHGAPPRNALEAALRNAWYGGGKSYEKTVGPAPIISISDAKPKPSKSLIVGMEPIQAGSGDPSPDNIRPITGRTGVTVERTGKNLLDASSVTHNAYNIGNIPNTLLPSTEYTFSINGVTGNRYRLYLAKSGAPLTAVVALNSDYIPSPSGIFSTFRTPEDMSEYQLLCLAGNINGAGNVPISDILPQCEIKASNTAYEPYVGQTYPISWQTEAGTVYGGTVDVVSGELTVDRYYFKGSWTQYNASNGFKAYRTQAIPYGRYANDNQNMPMSSVIGKFGSFSSGNMTENIIQPPRNNSNIAYMALDENVSPDDVDLTYLMATPQTYQLTPQQIQMLKGSNTLWSDGDSLTLTYLGTTPANLLGGMLGLGNPQEPVEQNEEPTEEPTEGDGE